MSKQKPDGPVAADKAPDGAPAAPSLDMPAETPPASVAKQPAAEIPTAKPAVLPAAPDPQEEWNRAVADVAERDKIHPVKAAQNVVRERPELVARLKAHHLARSESPAAVVDRSAIEAWDEELKARVRKGVHPVKAQQAMRRERPEAHAAMVAARRAGL